MLRLAAILLFFISPSLCAQQDFDVDQSVKMTATVTPAAPSITVNWVQDPRAVSYDLYRREYGSPSWGTKIGNYPASTVKYTDTTIVSEKLYEYKIEKFTDGVEGYGYVLSGIDLPPVHEAGRLCIVTTPATEAALMEELATYRATLEASGWPNQLITVSPDASSAAVKAAIVSAHANFAATALLLFGEVPLALSGDLNPDAHDDHKGAWPADLYYGDLDGVWTDTLVDNSTAATPVNHNIPGDGKWDQSFIPSDIELAVGRVDFTNLTVFNRSPEDLLRTYLQKNIAYRTKNIVVPPRAAMRNSNPWLGALGQNGIRNFSPLVGPDSITYGIWQRVFQEDYLWYYGAGSDAVRNGLSSAFANAGFQAVFTLWFSSYVGDYGLTDNYMKAVLGSGKALTAGWAGAPHWHLHSMAMGFPIGHGLVRSQNNDTLYTADFFPRSTHVNLLGDPTLNSFVVAPPSSLNVVQTTGGVALQWSTTNPLPDRWYLYRRAAGEERFRLLDSVASTVSDYLDQTASVGNSYDYLVRAAQLTTSPSGKFWNLSTGARAQILLSTSTGNLPPSTSVKLFPNPTSGRLTLSSSAPLGEVAVCSATGVTLRQITANAHQLTVDLSTLPAGTYFVRTIRSGQPTVRRVVVVR